MSQTVVEIVRAYLEALKYDGLYYEGECGCKVDDLAPCGDIQKSCTAGYVMPCDPATCPADGDCEWHIGPTKPE